MFYKSKFKIIYSIAFLQDKFWNIRMKKKFEVSIVEDKGLKEVNKRGIKLKIFRSSIINKFHSTSY